MGYSVDHLTTLSDEELAAADRATSREERIAHLEKAFRYAQTACLQRRRQSNLVELDPQR